MLPLVTPKARDGEGGRWIVETAFAIPMKIIDANTVVTIHFLLCLVLQLAARRKGGMGSFLPTGRGCFEVDTPSDVSSEGGDAPDWERRQQQQRVWWRRRPAANVFRQLRPLPSPPAVSPAATQRNQGALARHLNKVIAVWVNNAIAV